MMNEHEQEIVYLTASDVIRLSDVLSYAAIREAQMRLWVDGDGLKYSINGQTWSYPPIGSTVEP